MILTIVAGSFFAMRITGPPEVMFNAQYRTAAYVLDALHNGRWIVQRDEHGQIMSKPPMYVWLAATSAQLMGKVNEFSMSLPGGLAWAAVACVVYAAGRRYFDIRTGMLAGLACLACPLGARMISISRPDTLFCLAVTVAAMAGIRAWQRGGGWHGFWIASAVATLTKGPLGLLLASGGFLAMLWERGEARPGRTIRAHLPGIAIYLTLTLGWFGLAYLDAGRHLFDKMIGDELIDHAVGSGGRRPMLAGFYRPTLYLLFWCLPWSLLLVPALWRVVGGGSPDRAQSSGRDTTSVSEARPFERFLGCWLIVGLVTFSLASHHRPDLLLPLVPPAALLAARELTRRLRNVRTMPLGLATAAGVALMFGYTSYYYHGSDRSTRVVLSADMRGMAQWLRGELGEACPLTFVDSPFALQFYTQNFRPPVSYERARELLCGEAAAYIVADERTVERLEQDLQNSDMPCFRLASWPAGEEQRVHIIGNRDELSWDDPVAIDLGRIRIETAGAKLLGARGRELRFGEQGSVRVISEALRPIHVRVIHEGSDRSRSIVHRLEPGEVWDLDLLDDLLDDLLELDSDGPESGNT